jgi:hypothetical protein
MEGIGPRAQVVEEATRGGGRPEVDGAISQATRDAVT